MMAKYFDMQCEQCDEPFNTFEDAKNHYYTKHDKAIGFVKCCGRQFKTAQQTRNHLLWHIQPDLFKCTVCSVQLESLMTFKRHAHQHIGKIVRDGRRLKCNECGKLCYGAKGLSNHQQTHLAENGKAFTAIVHFYFHIQCCR